MKIVIEIIPHNKQRYETAGDWEYDAKKAILTIKISKLDNFRYEMLLAMHEAVEAISCIDAGIDPKKIDEFDKQYEHDRSEGKYTLDQEPGDDPQAPYREAHFLATSIERILAQAWGVHWGHYNSEVMSL